MSNLKEYVATRGYCKASITRLKNSLDKKDAQGMSLEKIDARRKRLQVAFDDYNAACITILALDPNDAEDSAEVEDNYLDILAELNTLYNKLAASVASVPTLGESSTTHKLNLPSVSIPLFEETKQHLAALKNLDQPVDSWDSIIVCILLRKLDVLTSRAFQMERQDRELPTVDAFLRFMDKRAQALESTEVFSQKPQAQRLTTNAVATQALSTCLYCAPTTDGTSSLCGQSTACSC